MNGATASEFEPFVPSSTVRAEYLNLPRDLAALSRIFGISLTPEHQRDATVLTLAIECTDRLLDALPQPEQRAQFSAAVAMFLTERRPSDDLTPELCGRLRRLAEVGERRGIHAPLCSMACELLNNSERMRTAATFGRFVACSVREGRLMVRMLLLILGSAATPAFSAFMQRLAEPANLVDKLRDAQRDYVNGEITLKPTVAFHARLIFELFQRTARLAPWAVVRWRLAVWGANSLFKELVRYSCSNWHSQLANAGRVRQLDRNQASECLSQSI